MTDGSLPTQSQSAKENDAQSVKNIHRHSLFLDQVAGQWENGKQPVGCMSCFQTNISKEPAGGDPINACANTLYLYYQVTSAHLYISCVTLWWEMICLQDTE